MTRLSVKDLNPRMRKQVINLLAEEERQKALKSVDDSHNTFLPEQSNSKYRSKKTTVVLPDGTEHTFDSTKEARVYNDLLIRLKAGEISNLRLQVPYELIPKQLRSNGKAERSVKYIADFVYIENGMTKVLDVKGYRKGQAYAIFTIKRKLMLWVHHIEVEEV